MTIRKMSELPDDVLRRIASKANDEVRKRENQLTWPESVVKSYGNVICGAHDPGAITAPCHGRSASEQLDHARRISDVANLWASKLGWSDGFMLMINVAESTRTTLQFDITWPVEVDTPKGRVGLMTGDTIKIQLMDGSSEVRLATPTPKPGILQGQWINPEAQKRVDLLVRHPFAQPSDVEAILAWEATLPKPDPLGDALAVPCAAPEAKPALSNAMVVRGGHDAAGWK